MPIPKDVEATDDNVSEPSKKQKIIFDYSIKIQRKPGRPPEKAKPKRGRPPSQPKVDPLLLTASSNPSLPIAQQAKAKKPRINWPVGDNADVVRCGSLRMSNERT
jgi:hypothetical protein